MLPMVFVRLVAFRAVTRPESFSDPVPFILQVKKFSPSGVQLLAQGHKLAHGQARTETGDLNS